MTEYGNFAVDDEFASFNLTNPLTRRGWQQYLINETMMFQVNQFGQGMSRYWDSEGRDVTLFESDVRSILVRNEDGSAWSPFVVPFGTVPEKYCCVYHPAFWEISGESRGCHVGLKIFIPVSVSLEFWRISVRNTSSAAMTRDLFMYLPVDLMGFSIRKYRFYSATTMFIEGFVESDCHAIWVKNGIPELPHDLYNVFLASEQPYTSFDSDRESFLGITGCLNAAEAVKKGICTNTPGYFGKTCLAMHHRLQLQPGQEVVLRYLTGPTSGSQHIQDLVGQYLNEEAFRNEEEQLIARCRREKHASEITSGIPSLDSLSNIWAKQQNRLGVTHRKGFRDVLQDSTGMLLYDQPRAVEGIREVLSVQKVDGSGIRAWKPYIDAEPYSDGPYWLVYAVSEYLKESGDLAFLELSLPYLDSPQPESVWQHLVKAVGFLYQDRSEYGLCRMRFADWNDGLDGVGPRGIGDSTMVTFGLIYAIRELQKLASATGRTLPFQAETMISTLEHALEQNAWCGDYFIRGYRDDGQPYGSPENQYGRIYLNPQAWAVLSEGTPESRWQTLLKFSIEKLGTSRGLRLFTPCYPEFDPYLGRVSAELPGVYENGAMYNHGAAFFLHALSKAGMAEESWKYLQMMLPDSEANPSDRSGAEPFVLTNCIFGEEARHRAGTSYFGWFTGTAAWVLRLVHNCYTGFQPELDGLHFHPEMIPQEIGLKRVHRTFRNTEYMVEYKHNGKPSISVNGVSHGLMEPLPQAPGKTIRVMVTY